MIDEILEILKNVETVKDYLNVCSLNKSIKNMCETYKKSIFLNLIKKKEFRKDYYDKFDDYLSDYDTNNIINLLKIYPVGNFFENNKFNSYQIDFFESLKYKNHINSKSIYEQGILHTYLINYAHLLFFPPNYFNIDLYTITSIKKDKLILFYLISLKKINKDKYEETITDIILDIFSETQNIHSKYTYKFLYKLVKIEPSITFTVFTVIQSVVSSEYPEFILSLNTLESEEFADFFAENYETVKKLCIDFNINEFSQ